jgi:hypothetical protein
LIFKVCGCKTWPLTLREKYRLRLLEKSVLKVYVSSRSDVTVRLQKVI